MKMKTIEMTTTEIEETLKSRFNKVEKLLPIKLEVINNSTQARVVSVLNFKGLVIIIGCYSYNTEEEIEKDDDDVKFARYALLLPVSIAYTF